MSQVKTAVFPVAGLGTRFLPATKSIPKEMLPVVDKPVLHYAVDEARAAGIERFVFVTSRGKTPLEDHFDRHIELERTLQERGKDDALNLLAEMDEIAGNVVFVRQPEPLGLGHAIWCARNFVGDGAFAVLLPDELLYSDPPCLTNLVHHHAEMGGGHVISVRDVPLEDTRKYGILDVTETLASGLMCAKGMVEKPNPKDAPSTQAVIGRYVLEPNIFEYLDKGVRGAGNEIQLTDAIAATLGDTPLYGVPFAGERYDCGDKLGFLKATVAMALNRPDLGPGLRDFIKDLDI